VNLALWELVVAAWDDVSALRDRALPRGASGPAVSTAVLDQLRDQLRGRLTTLENDLAARVGEPEAKSIVFPLILHLDEQVLSELPRCTKLSWHRLQDDVLEDEVGGEVFYSRLDKLLQQPPDVQSIALDVYYFCLSDGFHGRFDDDDVASIKRYERDIQTHLGQPAGTVPSSGGGVSQPVQPAGRVPGSGGNTPSVSPAPPRPQRSPWLYYGVTAVLVLLIVVLPIALSNL
jgi:type IV/VI secretion system ImpK/VasF family protein